MSTALYRRYRPETFAEVIGQDHVTGPLMQALRSGRVNHAYLFSGPRGCGKTTSARILARTLNCAKNTPETPIDTPCGECPSCVELARGGSGSLDVVEIDAASHNGVDDARDLRERATFAPARDRYKIFILDEAHMVTPQGFNALLKIVEEPPPHIKFIFATTEPDKVIGTIRSRTHHYPFRLVPPDVLSPYLEQLCGAEGVEVGGGVLPLVTRAGGGSVRDSLSVMDQLIAGATGGVVDYDLAVGLLGFTHATLLDDVVDALAARDGGSIFRVVDQIIATGHEPRRFVEDVLERLRDLIVIGVSGDAASAVLRGIPTDQLERMRTQAGRLGVAELSRAADLVNAALTEMTGATSPRLHLELLCARLLLPGADDGTAGLAARIDRLERGGIVASGAPAAPGPGRDAAPDGAPAPEPTTGGLAGAAAARAVLDARKKRGEPGQPAAPEPARPEAKAAPAAPVAAAEPSSAGEGASGPTARAEPEPEPAVQESPAQESPAPESPVQQAPARPVPEPADASASAAPSAAPASGSPGAEPGVTTETVRRRWPEVLGALAAARVTWSLVGPNAQVVALEGNTLKLGFAAPGLARTFSNARHTSAVEEAVYQTLGIRVRVEATLDEGPAGGGEASGGGTSGGGPSGGASSGGGPSGGGAGPASGEPRREAPAPTAAAAPEWPDVPPPGGRAATVSAPSASADALPVAGAAATAAAGAAGGGLSGRSAALAPVSAQGSVAVAERPEPSRPEPSGPEPGRPEPARPAARPPSAASAADEAWLSGASATEPPADYDMPEPEPVYEDQAPAPARAPMSGAGGAREALRQANERRARAASGADAEPRRGTAAGAAASTSRAAAPADEPDFYDEPSADDPDIASAGMVGVPLVVQVLGGTVIDEIVEQP
ncbi:DNA polymerase III subunit gamma and tau [Promicromonospora iranensis]|uniref:DNA-directed DNA polymerase n=1 Tax=Promicromonospora iranensis TaxID=1105144 RepID=A0ABU2CQQ1_9MICO|nr:DNA polymerase III subunit gamma and tau [Promicromonospora iranensis]MDR7383649.1 DNA polymerase-3 subunit gamma/tau [Promicromonospora iranensis]